MIAMSLRFALVSLGALAAMPALAQTAAPAPAAPPPPACAGAEHRQFDFWVGEWDVYPTGKPNQVATSKIEGLYAGCVVRENWMPFKGSPGGSLNMYDAQDKKWRQTWADAAGSWVEFTGGHNGTAMVLTGNWRGAGGPGQDSLTRMTYTKSADGSVRQLGEASTDGGKTWGPSFDFTYKPKAAPKP
jgi:hypothetical protein